MQALLREIEDFASSNLPVLIRGESGTGKELVAGAIQRLSGRRARGYQTINCADFTPELLRSELFGHERGAFTGAVGKTLANTWRVPERLQTPVSRSMVQRGRLYSGMPAARMPSVMRFLNALSLNGFILRYREMDKPGASSSRRGTSIFASSSLPRDTRLLTITP